MLRRWKSMDERQARDALYGGERTVRAEPLTLKADPKRAGERIRKHFEERLNSRDDEEAA